MNKRHLILATRADISDGAARTLLEIILHIEAGGEVPSLTDLSGYRGRFRSVLQSHISELVTCGVLQVNKLVLPKEGYGKRLTVSEDGLARANGFPDFKSVVFDKYLAVKAGNVRESSKGKSLISVTQKPSEIDTPTKLLKYFQVKYQERYKKSYEQQKGDLTFFKKLIQYHGKKRSVSLVEVFFRENHSYRCGRDPKGLFSIREALESKITQ